MEKFVDLGNVSCVLPRWEEARIVSEILHGDGESGRFPVKPETVIRWIANRYCIDFDRARRRSEAECRLGKGAPIPIGLRNVFLPFHLVEEGNRQHSTAYAFCNVAIQELEVCSDDARGENCSRLRLESGRELPTDWSPATLRHRLALAVDSYQRILRNTWKEMPAFSMALVFPAGLDDPVKKVGA